MRQHIGGVRIGAAIRSQHIEVDVDVGEHGIRIGLPLGMRVSGGDHVVGVGAIGTHRC